MLGDPTEHKIWNFEIREEKLILGSIHPLKLLEISGGLEVTSRMKILRNL
jgi:hypothetical protein